MTTLELYSYLKDEWKHDEGLKLSKYGIRINLFEEVSKLNNII